MKQVKRLYGGRPRALGVLALALAFLVQSGLRTHAQSPATPSANATLETWRTYGNNAASKAHAAAATLTPAQRNQARSLFATAFDLGGGGNFDAAKIAFERGLAIDPSNGAAEYYLAETLVKMTQVKEALPHYAAAMGLAPNAKEGIEAEAALRKLLPTIPAERASVDVKKAGRQAADTALTEAQKANVAALVAALTEKERARIQGLSDTANSCVQQCNLQFRTCDSANTYADPPNFSALCPTSVPADPVKYQACMEKYQQEFQIRVGPDTQNRVRCGTQRDQCQAACKQACGAYCSWK
jgi:tetratricopeptide (TPR) repeat protein